MSKENLEWFQSLVATHADELKLEFAFNLDKAIQERGFKRTTFADKVGSSPAWVTNVLRGDVNLTIESMAKLTEAVGYNLHIELKKKQEKSLVTSASKFRFSQSARGTYHGGREVTYSRCQDTSQTSNEPDYANAA